MATAVSASVAAVAGAAPAVPAASARAVAPTTSDFAGKLGALVSGVEQSTTQANTAIHGMLDKSVDVHDAMIALQQSELALQLTVQVRNKLVQAYQDIMRMPV